MSEASQTSAGDAGATPLTLVTGPLGAGKTTLLRHLITGRAGRLAVIVNEFGELGIDGRLLEGRNVRLTELDGGCVCCSLIGEFEAALAEILERVAPAAIVVETTGVAEPEAIVYDVAEGFEGVRLDGVVTIMDADAMESFPELGATTRMQVAVADLIVLNKVDLVPGDGLEALEAALRRHNPRAPVVRTEHCRVDLDLVFGIARAGPVSRPVHSHQPEYQSFVYRSERAMDRDRFLEAVATLAPAVYRAKGIVRLAGGGALFNYVNGRTALEPWAEEPTALVFIGRAANDEEARIGARLRAAEIADAL